MAATIPNICAYIEETCRYPFLLGNLELLMEDFIARLHMNNCQNSSCTESSKSEENKEEIKDPESMIIIKCSESSERSSSPPIHSLINSLRDIMEDVTKTAEVYSNNDKRQEPLRSITDKSDLVPKLQEEITITNNTRVSSGCEFKFNFEGCSSDSIKLEVEEGILKATAKMEDIEGIKTISYDKKIPSDIDVSSLKATFHEGGMLKIIGSKMENLPLQ